MIETKMDLVTRRSLLRLAGTVAAAVGLPGPLAAQTSQHSAHAAASAAALFLKFQDLKWEKIVPEFGGDSPEIAFLRIDPKTQATHLMIRAPKEFYVPRHWHTANETHTVINGTCIFECDGKREELGPGSFNYIPSKIVHQAWIKPGGAWFLITVDSAWDINWVDGPPKPPKS